MTYLWPDDRHLTRSLQRSNGEEATDVLSALLELALIRVETGQPVRRLVIRGILGQAELKILKEGGQLVPLFLELCQLREQLAGGSILLSVDGIDYA